MTTILVVDDEFLVADVLVFALEEEGFRVITAANGRKALELLKREQPSVIVTDFMMPLMNGLEFAEAVKADPTLSDLPIILVSGAQGAVARAHGHLFAAIYDKPFSVHKVVARIRELIGASPR